jgi:predicted RNA-binding protein YlxR (DUF448 family)
MLFIGCQQSIEQKELIRLVKQVGYVSADAHTFYRGKKDVYE